ncbi:MAG: hypothetical protein JNK79_02530 [Chitinophagaceae bacterium]|nr:hypothetical protein [Chitinophagaceae bacterium]
MSTAGYDIVPYSEDRADQLLQFERGIVQGKRLQLEIIKDHFLDRARVFKHSHALVALSDGQEAIGSLIGAETILEINGDQIHAGFAFDAKVTTGSRKRGIGRQLAKELYRTFFEPTGLKQNFMTVKKENTAVWMLLSKLLSKVWVYDFVYLTIPASSRLQNTISENGGTVDFGVKLFEPDELSRDYYRECAGGLGYLNSHKLYRLRIKKISPVLKLSITLLRKLRPRKYGSAPHEGEILSFATLYGHTPANIGGINTILEEIENNGIGQLLVCCRKGDAIYRALKKTAVNNYNYCIVTDFPIGANDHVYIDVRCL